jgi:rhomboid family GlyGly-CTERM serine protease
MARLPGAWLLALPALLFQPPGWAGRLQLDFAAVSRGEPWRWVTCHWTHWSLDHLAWDLGAFLLLAAVCESRSPRRLLAAVASAALLIPAVLGISMPAMGSYRGLSGIDSALFVLAAVLVGREEQGMRRLPAVLAVAGFLAKAVYESATGTALFAESAGSFVPAPLAHLAGGVCGLFAGAAYNPLKLRKGGFDAQEARADG